MRGDRLVSVVVFVYIEDDMLVVALNSLSRFAVDMSAVLEALFLVDVPYVDLVAGGTISASMSVFDSSLWSDCNICCCSSSDREKRSYKSSIVFLVDIVQELTAEEGSFQNTRLGPEKIFFCSRF